MDKRIITLAAASFAAMTLAGATPANAAGQCEASCDKAFQQCNGSNPDTSACLPRWGQCKRACNPAKAATPAKAVTPAPAMMTKAATPAKPKT